jgi:2'-hydroxyisoflavone reductase
LQILIIGGSQFIGKTLLEILCLDSINHNVYIFNRGNHEIDSSIKVSRIVGDRSIGFESLSKVKFDIVFDMCGFKPTDFKHINQLNFDRYVFISSTAVYDTSKVSEIDESGPIRNFSDLRDLSETELEMVSIDSSNYGPLKMLCEEKLQSLCSNLIVIRPCIVLGKNENTGRLQSWFKALNNNEVIWAQANKDLVFQFIDVRDLANLMIKIGFLNYKGIFNLCAPPITWELFVNTSVKLQPSTMSKKSVLDDSSSSFLDYSRKMNGAYFKSGFEIVRDHHFYQAYETLGSFI